MVNINSNWFALSVKIHHNACGNFASFNAGTLHKVNVKRIGITVITQSHFRSAPLEIPIKKALRMVS